MTHTNNINGSYNQHRTENLNKSTTLQANNNSGLLAAAGVNCKRSLQEVEVERRELDTGASVLAALGGDPAAARGSDDITSPLHLLATRDLGKMAHMLQVRAKGHDWETATNYKRHVGVECAPDNLEECDEQTKAEAQDLLRVHARQLGFDLRW